MPRTAPRSASTPVLVVDGDTVLATPDQLKGATVTGHVVGTTKGPKINGFTYKRRTNQRRRYGHRQHYTTVEITAISPRLRSRRCRRPRVAAPPATAVTPTPSASASRCSTARTITPARSSSASAAREFHPGHNVGRGGDDTLFARTDGRVKFGERRGRRVVDVQPVA